MCCNKYEWWKIIRGRTIKFVNSPPCACRGSTGQKPWYGLMTLTYQCFTAVLLLIYGSLFLSGIYYCLRVFGVPSWECRSLNLPRPFGEVRWHFGPCHHRWWNMGLPIQPWNEVAKWTMEDCQFPTTKKIPSVQIKSQNNVADFFLILKGLFIINLYQLDKQSTKFTIWKYWEGCMKKLDGNDPNFLPTTHGSCITTMHLLIRHCLWETL